MILRGAIVMAALLLAGCTSPQQPDTVPLEPDAGIAVTLVGWENGADSALVEVALENNTSTYSEFVIDTAITDPTGTQIWGYGPVVLNAVAGGGEVMGQATIAGPIPADAKAGIANVWGRVPGDEQIHTVALAPVATDTQDAASTTGLAWPTSRSAQPPPTDWTEAQTMAAAEVMASRLGSLQKECREDRSVAGLVCLTRRNVPAYLLPDDTASFLSVVPYFSQPEAGDGPPRAFEVDDGRHQACVGQRIDKQTSAQVAIAGSCSQRGLFPGFGGVTGLTAATDVAPQAGTAPPSWTSPAGTDPPERSGQRTDVGTAFAVGGLVATVVGVQVDLVTLAAPGGELAAEDGFTVVTVELVNPAAADVDVRQLSLTVLDGQGVPLPPSVTAEEALGSTRTLGVVPAGGSAQVLLVHDLPVGVTATTLVVTDAVSGQSASIGLLPPVS